MATAIVTFDPPANDGGSPILWYVVTSHEVNGNSAPISEGGISSPISVTGLSNDVEYFFTVTAENAIGVSAPSEPSNVLMTPSPLT